jgi:hypothetical protein
MKTKSTQTRRYLGLGTWNFPSCVHCTSEIASLNPVVFHYIWPLQDQWPLLTQWGRWLPAGFLLCIIHTCMDGRTTQNTRWFSISSVASHTHFLLCNWDFNPPPPQKKKKKNLLILQQPIVTEFYKHFNFVLKTLKTIGTCKSFCVPRAY